MDIIELFFIGAFVGAVCGIAPLVLGRFLGRNSMGMLGLLCSACSGALLGAVAAVLTAVAFCIVVLATKRDARSVGQPPIHHTPQIMCMSGSMQGRVYNITNEGLILGRDPCCSMRLSGSAAGVSRRHCRVRLVNGQPVLEDLQSSYGTFLATGQRLVPNTPVTLTNGSRFYLGDQRNQFQITI